VTRFHHIVLILAAIAMLWAEQGLQLTGIASINDISGRIQIPVHGSLIAEQPDPGALQINPAVPANAIKACKHGTHGNLPFNFLPCILWKRRHSFKKLPLSISLRSEFDKAIRERDNFPERRLRENLNHKIPRERSHAQRKPDIQ